MFTMYWTHVSDLSYRERAKQAQAETIAELNRAQQELIAAASRNET